MSCGDGGAVGDDFAAFDRFAFEHADVAPLRNQRFVRVAIGRCDHQPSLALRLLTEADGSGCLCEDRRFLRLARFEQVRHPRQTAGDVAGLRPFLRNPRDDVADADFFTVFEAQDRIGRQQVVRRHVGTGQEHFLAFAVDQTDRRTQILTCAGTVFRIEHQNVGQAGQLVGLTVDRTDLLPCPGTRPYPRLR